jgi:CRP-like cAMP-binding protein
LLQKAGRAFDPGQGRGPAGWDSRRIRKDSQQIESIVAGVPLFRGLPRARLAAVARAARLLLVRRGAYVARRGEPLAGLFAVGKGMINVALRGSGGERVLRFVGPGETFAEAAALLGRASTVDAVALADSVLAVIAVPPLRALMVRDPALSLRMAVLLAERLLTLLAEIEASELRPAGERLAAYLLGLAEPAGGSGRLTAHLPATKTLIASRLGMKKETLSRLLHDLSNRRLIEVSRREIAILDRRGLGEIARS